MKLRRFWPALLLLLPVTLLAQQPKSTILEEIIARVNNQIITKSELANAQQAVVEEVAEDCKACTQDQMRQMVAERQKTTLRDLIDQQLLVQRAQDLGINVETRVIQQLDYIRRQNNIPNMDELEAAVNKSGVSFEDFKNRIRNQFLTQEVIRGDVGREVKIDPEEAKKYYEEHKKDFDRPEQVYLSEIFVSTEAKPESEVAELKAKAETYLSRVKNGEDFNVMAEHYSDGSTAKQGGQLGAFQHGQLAPEIEQIVFALKRGEVTSVIESKGGFLILKVDMKYDAGIQPYEKVEPEIYNVLHQEKIQPALRGYLDNLREDSYIYVKPGYEESAGVVASGVIKEVQPVEDEKGKKSKSKD